MIIGGGDNWVVQLQQVSDLYGTAPHYDEMWARAQLRSLGFSVGEVQGQLESLIKAKVDKRMNEEITKWQARIS